MRALRATKWLIIGAGTGLLALLALALLVVVALLCLIGVGLLLVAPALDVTRGVANLERQRLGAVGRRPSDSYDPIPQDWRLAWRFALFDVNSRRDISWVALHGTFGLLLGALPLELISDTIESMVAPVRWALTDGTFLTINRLITVESATQAWLLVLLGVGFAAVWLISAPWLLRAQTAAGKRLLSPHPDVDLSKRVAQLTASRAAALDAHAVELRRIERALHDGAQNRLVTVALLSGAARQSLTRDATAVEPLLERIQDSAETALAELRTLVRGILPPVLESQGLPGALSALAAECPIDVSVDVHLTSRCPMALEAIAYYTVAEALTNVSRHSHAAVAQVHVRRHEARLHVAVTDNGIGGANVVPGSGLAGIRDRVRAHDGVIQLSSPTGGPTILEVVLPCE